MPEPLLALTHYGQAIRALKNGQYDGLSKRERQALLQVLNQEKRRVLARVAHSIAISPRGPRCNSDAACSLESIGAPSSE